jgi:hypothetical protein
MAQFDLDLLLLDDLAHDMAAALLAQPGESIVVSRERLTNWLARTALVVAALQEREGDSL